MKGLAFFVITLVSYSSTVTGYGSAKEGKCPPSPRHVNCSAELDGGCYQDLECPGTQKCCNDGCGRYVCKNATDLPVLPVVEPCRLDVAKTLKGRNCTEKNVTYCSKIGCKKCCTHTSTCSPFPGIYIKREECEKQLCKGKRCVGQGEICTMDKYHRATCVCPQSCPKDFPGGPVCGTDKVTYPNECEMNMTACVLGDIIKVVHQGSCDDLRAPDSLEICNLPKDKGHGGSLRLRYYFSAAEGICKGFLYHGKNGNKNNFKRVKDCRDHCSKTVKDVCVLPTIVGPCRAAMPRWSFNKASGQCENFTYGGCGGNGNNFRTEALCEKKCEIPRGKNICNLPKAPGPCEAYIRQWYYHSLSKKCKQFVYGGCKGNENRFKTKQECDKACRSNINVIKTRNILRICNLPKDKGHGDLLELRYYFNAAKGICEGFLYHGQNGNENNFKRVKDCRHRCSKAVKDVCVLPKVVGPCRAAMPRWYFNKASRQCEFFTYGGCAGNGNNFRTKVLCEAKCGTQKSKNICNLPKAPGLCLGSFPSWYYDNVSKKCERFNYGGCQGNKNRFESEKECNMACGTPSTSVITGNPFAPRCLGRNKFNCRSIKKCIPASKKCNGRDDCGDNSDERGCDEVDTFGVPHCRGRNRFSCRSVKKCIPASKRCNGRDDCGDNSDEKGCDNEGVPCPIVPCKFYAKCQFQTTFRATAFCQCPQICTADWNPVCGSDGQTYPNLCTMKVQSCEKQTLITKIKDGDCNDGPKSKCQEERDAVDHDLPGVFVAQCREDGSYNPMQCQSSTGYCWCVDKNGNKLDDTEIRFDRPNCTEETLPTTEPFDICDISFCEFGECVNVNGTATCQCQKACPFIENPVCGSDNKTYSNLCVMEAESCERKEHISLQYHGQCGLAANASSKSRSNCERERDSVPEEIVGAFIPRCEDDGSYSKVQCHGSTGYCWCVDEEGNKLEGTEVRSDQVNCDISNETVSVTPEPFDICDISFCEFGECVNVNGTATCQCHKACPFIENPVCGSDNKTYSNLCVMEAESCERKEHISLQYHGQCGLAANASSNSRSSCERERDSVPEGIVGAFIPSCEDDGSYSKVQCHGSTGYCWCVDEEGNKLEGTEVRSDQVNCDISNETVSVTPEPFDICDISFCEFGECVNVNGTATCQCQKACPFIENPVCGSDNKTYSNLCVMEAESCERKEHISLQYHGQCDLAANASSKSRSNCERERDSVPEGIVGAFIPSCEDDGSYSKVQCHGSTGYCWCVDEEGNKLEGTEVRSDQVNCDISNETVSVTPEPFDICDISLCEFGKCVNINGSATCQCQKACPLIENPVCGSDEKTYSNLCVMEAESCERKKHISLQYHGRCVSDCQRKRQASEPESMFGAFVPQCEEDGSYKTIQCHDSVGFCWCVDALGNELPGSQVRGTKPDCAKAVEKACQGVSCDFYGTCVPFNGTTICECPKFCTRELDPVCGSNNKTYDNLCKMKVESCEKRELIWKKRIGKCGEKSKCEKQRDSVPADIVGAFIPVCREDGSYNKTQCYGSTGYCWCVDEEGNKFEETEVRFQKPDCDKINVISTVDPCATVRCGYFSKCEVIDGDAQCVCDKACTREYNPLCGSDGVTYSNPCELRKASCEQEKQINVTKTGECDPCATVRCGYYSKCEVIEGDAQCVCDKACTREYDPQCGSDGLTYPNPCELRKASCEQEKQINVTKTGKCEDPCATVRCGFFSKCEVFEGDARCVCDQVCTDEYNPQCGSDGVTYSNPCELRKASCEQRNEINVTNVGQCDDPCATVRCGFYSKCEVIDGSAKCVCNKACTREYDPQCGSNGVTYSNPCELRKASCEQMKIINVRKVGECEDPCATVKCGLFSKCKVIDGDAQCVCDKACTREYNPLCGSDGVTYSNLCELQKASCEQEKQIKVRKTGECVDPCARVRCDFYSKCEVIDGGASCVCDRACTKEYDPQCGSDGVTYSNPCKLREASCEQLKQINITKPGECEVSVGNCTVCPVTGTKKVVKSFCSRAYNFVIRGVIEAVADYGDQREVTVKIRKRYKPRKLGRTILKHRDSVKIIITGVNPECSCEVLNQLDVNGEFVFMGVMTTTQDLILDVERGFIQKASNNLVSTLKKGFRRHNRNWRFCRNINRG